VEQENLNEANKALMDTLIDMDLSQEDIEAEITSVEEYDDKISIDLSRLRAKAKKNVNPGSRPASPVASEYSTASGMGSSTSKKKTYRLPKIEIKTFDGEILNWLGWWAQFQKIHEDEELHDSDKFQYLMQAVVGQAKILIEGFPQSSENYQLATEALQRRFGNPSVLRTSYIRELTKVVITSVKRKFKLSELYDKLSSHRRALKTLGACLNPDDFIYPLVKSSLPEDTLIAWHRNQTLVVRKYENSSKLDRLMEFLDLEVEAEQKINLTRTRYLEHEDRPKNKAKIAKDTTT